MKQVQTYHSSDNFKEMILKHLMVKTYKSNFKTIYKLFDNDYYLMSSKEEIGFEKKIKER